MRLLKRFEACWRILMPKSLSIYKVSGSTGAFTTERRRMDAIIPRLCAMYAAQPLVMAPAEPAKRHAHNPDGEA